MAEEQGKSKFVMYLRNLRETVNKAIEATTGSALGTSPSRFHSSPGSFKQHRRKELALSKRRKTRREYKLSFGGRK